MTDESKAEKRQRGTNKADVQEAKIKRLEAIVEKMATHMGVSKIVKDYDRNV